MSYNDPDGEPYRPMTKEDVVAWYMSGGASREAAEWHWERLSEGGKPVYAWDLEE